MAVVRARSAPPYALILFVVLWVVSTALAVTFYLMMASADSKLTTNDKQLNDIANDRERTTVVPQLLSQRTLPTASALGTAQAQITQLKNAIGAHDAAVSEIVAPQSGLVSQALVRTGQPTTGNLLETVSTLGAKLVAANKQVASLTADLNDLRASVTSNKQNYDASAASANKTASDFQNQLLAANGQVSSSNADKQAGIASVEKELTTEKEGREADRRETVLQSEQLKQQLAQANDRIEKLTQEIGTLRPTNNTNVGRESAGRVVRAATGAGEIYISLGSQDHVTPGLTFAVYDSQSGVRYDTEEDAKGKGSIEVMDVGATESLCRITQATPGQTIGAGDLIANPVYQHDKNRAFHFVVVGDFDLDADGVATSTERDRLIRMIKSWGGVIDDKLSTQTDFLVAGSRPAGPAVTTDDSTVGGLVDERTKKQTQYDSLVDEAKHSSVPILNQNRFLAMIGYHNTTVIRY